MKPLKMTVILLAVGLLLFTFIPTPHSADEVTQGFMATTVSRGNITYDPFQLVKAVGLEDLSADSEVTKDITQKLQDKGGLADHLYEFTETSDPYGPTVRTCGPKTPNSLFGEYRSNYGGYHGGVDLSPQESASGYCVWTCALFSGTVRECYYNTSWGRTIVVESDAVPGLYFRYAHLGPGNATSYGGTMPSWQTTLKYENGEKITMRGQSPTSYESGNGYKGYSNKGTWAGGGVLAKVGDHVTTGQRLGLYGTTGNSTALHSHIELYFNYNPVTKVVEPYEVTGRVPFVTYRTDAYTVIANGGFDESTWIWYISKDSVGGNTALTAAEVTSLMGVDWDPADSMEGGGSET